MSASRAGCLTPGERDTGTHCIRGQVSPRASRDVSEKRKIYFAPTAISEARGGTVGSGTALQAGRSRVRFPTVPLEFFIDIILPAAL